MIWSRTSVRIAKVAKVRGSNPPSVKLPRSRYKYSSLAVHGPQRWVSTPPPTVHPLRLKFALNATSVGMKTRKSLWISPQAPPPVHVPQPVSIGVAEAGAHGCKPIQLLLGGEEGTTVTGATNTNTRQIFLGCSLEIPFNTDDPIRRELIIVSNLSAPYETGELQAW